MDRSVALLLTIVGGGLIAFQAPVNGRFGRTIGSIPAGAVSFAIGTIALLTIVAVRGELGRVGEAAHVPWWYLTGGVLGATYVTTVLITIGSLGAGPVVAATIAGQLTVSLLIDQFGWLGVARDPITVSQVLGVVLLGLGVYLVVRT